MEKEEEDKAMKESEAIGAPLTHISSDDNSADASQLVLPQQKHQLQVIKERNSNSKRKSRSMDPSVELEEEKENEETPEDVKRTKPKKQHTGSPAHLARGTRGSAVKVQRSLEEEEAALEWRFEKSKAAGSQAPCARWGGAGAYVKHSEEYIVFGGMDEDGSPLSDVYSLKA